MKKIFVGAAAVALTIMGVSCKGGVSLKTTEDSAAYAQGMQEGKRYGEMISMSESQGMKMDKEAFLKGFEEALKDSTKFSYFAGGITGSQIAKQLIADSVNVKNYLAAFKLAIKGDSTAKYMIPDSIAESIVMRAQQIRQEKAMKAQEAELEKQFGANKKKGADFIAAFKKEAGVKTTASGLAYKVITEGTGATPTIDDTVKASYVGTLSDGKEFDKGDNVEFPLRGVIPGWTEILQLMKVGGKLKVVIPQELAYGAHSQSPIEPFSTLVFEIELKDVKKAEAAH